MSSKKIVVKHRRGTTAEWQEWLNDPNNILLDGEIALEDVPELAGQPNRLRMLIGDGTHHTYDTMPKIDMPGYAKTVTTEFGEVVTSQGYDYAEFFKWSDGNPDNEDRSGYFVTIVENTRTIRKAKSTDKILGIATKTASLIGNFSEDKQDDPSWSQIGLLGIIEAKHDGTCTANGYAMINDNGEATHTDEAFGYKIVNVNDEAGTIEVILGNDSDMISRLQERVADLEGGTMNTEKIVVGGTTIYTDEWGAFYIDKSDTENDVGVPNFGGILSIDNGELLFNGEPVGSGGDINIKDLTTDLTNNPLTEEEKSNFMRNTGLDKTLGDIEGSVDELEIHVGDIEDSIGDIDTALDSIIAIQNELIGGGA